MLTGARLAADLRGGESLQLDTYVADIPCRRLTVDGFLNSVNGSPQRFSAFMGLRKALLGVDHLEMPLPRFRR